jgi:outer membrane biogenesis lipoprotein LolB
MLVAVALLAGCAAPAARNPQVSQTNPTHKDNGAAPGQSGQPRGTQGPKEDGQVKGQDVFLLYEPENAAVLAGARSAAIQEPGNLPRVSTNSAAS